MTDKTIRKLVLTAMFASLVCVATMIIQVPSPMGGYVNVGDCFVLLGAWTLGPIFGAAAGGLGTMMSDVLMGYAYWAPGSLVIKGLVALIAAKLYKMLGQNRKAMIVGGLVGESVMVLGYFSYAALILGRGLSAAASVPGNLVQASVGIIAAVLLASVGRRAHLWEDLEG